MKPAESGIVFLFHVFFSMSKPLAHHPVGLLKAQEFWRLLLRHCLDS